MAGTLLISAAWKSTAVLGAAWVCALLLRRRSASERHLVWTLAAAAVIVLPLLSAFLPAWSAPFAPQFLPEKIGLVFHSNAYGSSASLWPETKLRAAYGSFNWLVLLWAGGTFLAFAQMLAAYAAVWRAGRTAQPFIDRGVCAELPHLLGIRRLVRLLEASAGSMPMTFGFVGSAIFLPCDAAGWSEERLRTVLLHELAHVRRHDVPIQMLARFALCLYWWNPLAWVAWREFLRERERAADDLVLSAGASATDYAGHLLEVARALRPASVTSWAAVAMVRRPSQLEDRLKAILDSNLNRQTPARMWKGVAALLAVALVIPLAAVKAQGTISPSAANERRQPAKLISLGTAAILKGDLPLALGYFERARSADAGDAVPVMWMAVVRERQQNFAEAEQLYQRALSLQNPRSAEAVTTLKLYSRFLREQGRLEEAKDLDARAAALPPSNAAIMERRPGVYRIGSGISAPKVVSKIDPSYSEEARAAKLAGRVVVYAEIGADGRAHSLRIVRPLGLGLDGRALEAIGQWRFEPAAKDGQAVTVAATIEVNFRLI